MRITLLSPHSGLTQLFAATVVILFSSSLSLAGQMYQSCKGVMVEDNDFGFHLSEITKGEWLNNSKYTWCDATFGGSVNTDKILRICPLGSVCKVEGYFEGHGVFNWTKIKTIKRIY